MRKDGRRAKQLREVTLKTKINAYAEGSCLAQFGLTKVHCTASEQESLPRWRDPKMGGWITGEYDMLPRANRSRGYRNSGRDGRSREISRLIGRSLRAVSDLAKLPAITITIDCDVLQADGGTRTAAITGGFVALVEALRWCQKRNMIDSMPLKDSVAAISTGIVNQSVLLDLDYEEDSNASVDANFVITGKGQLVEVQASGEEATFSPPELDQLLKLAQTGTRQLNQMQKKVLGRLSFRSH